jgi:hypothetical protein
VTIHFLAPSHVANHILATVRALQTVFAQAFEVPSSWLEISMAEDTVTAAKTAAGQKLFMIVIRIGPAHYTTQLIAHVRRVLSDMQHVANLLAAAVPGATLVGSTSIQSPFPPPMPLSPSSAALGVPPSTPAPHCKLCPAGFKCPTGSAQPVPCEEGTRQPNMGAAECVKVAQVLNLTSNMTADDNVDAEESAITSEQAFVNYLPVVVAVPAVLLVLCLLLICGLCVWRRRYTQQAMMRTNMLREGASNRSAKTLAVLVQDESAPSDARVRLGTKAKPRIELRNELRNEQKLAYSKTAAMDIVEERHIGEHLHSKEMGSGHKSVGVHIVEATHTSQHLHSKEMGRGHMSRVPNAPVLNTLLLKATAHTKKSRAYTKTAAKDITAATHLNSKETGSNHKDVGVSNAPVLSSRLLKATTSAGTDMSVSNSSSEGSSVPGRCRDTRLSMTESPSADPHLAPVICSSAVASFEHRMAALGLANSCTQADSLSGTPSPTRRARADSEGALPAADKVELDKSSPDMSFVRRSSRAVDGKVLPHEV